MGSEVSGRPHVVCVPYPAQGHVTPVLKVAKLLHSRGVYITFVNTEFNHKRFLRSRGPESLNGLDDFTFETIPDGLPQSDKDATQDIEALCDSTSKHCLAPFRQLLAKLNNTPNVPKVTSIVSDGVMSFTLDAADELNIPEVLFWTPSSIGFMCYLHYHQFLERGLTPLKDDSYLTNGYLDTPVDWIPGMKHLRLRDATSFIRTTNRDDIILNFAMREASRASRAKAIIMNTFNDFEHDVLQAMRSILPPLYTIGPLQLLCNNQLTEDNPVSSIGSNLWKEDTACLDWLDTKDPGSVVYVNYSSITIMSAKQLEEFAWGLANSNHLFLWIIRPDLVDGESAVIPQGFVEATKGRGMLASWCPQEKVLKHPSIGVFLTHCGWNSMLETICGGVPVICWPFFAEQQTNCRYACKVWEIGMEIDTNVKREEVEGLVREMMEGYEGKKMRNKALEWKNKAEEAAKEGGSSYVNFEKLLNLLLGCNK